MVPVAGGGGGGRGGRTPAVEGVVGGGGRAWRMGVGRVWVKWGWGLVGGGAPVPRVALAIAGPRLLVRATSLAPLLFSVVWPSVFPPLVSVMVWAPALKLAAP